MCLIARGGGGRTGCRSTEHPQQPGAFVGLVQGTGLLWCFGWGRGGNANKSCASPQLSTGPLPWQKHRHGLALAGVFGHTPPRDAGGDGLRVAEQVEGRCSLPAMSSVLGSAVGHSTEPRRCPAALSPGVTMSGLGPCECSLWLGPSPASTHSPRAPGWPSSGS